VNALIENNRWEEFLSQIFHFARQSQCTNQQRLTIASVLIDHLWLSEARSLVVSSGQSHSLIRDYTSQIDAIENPTRFLQEMDLNHEFDLKMAINCLSRENRYDELIDLGFDCLKPHFSPSLSREVLRELSKFTKSNRLVELLWAMFERRDESALPDFLPEIANGALWCGDKDLFSLVKQRVLGLSGKQTTQFVERFGFIDENTVEHACNDFLNIRSLGFDLRPDVELVTILYGDKYTKDFVEYCLPSVLKSRGMPSFIDRHKILWTFYTTADYAPKLERVLTQYVPSAIAIRINVRLFGNGEAASLVRGYSFQYSLKRCAEAESSFLLVSPDLIFGDGLAEMIQQCPGGGVAAAHHFRVFDRALYQAWPQDSFNRELTCSEKNVDLLRHSLTDFSLYWTRATVLNARTRAPERIFQIEKSGTHVSGKSFNACLVGLVFRPDEKMYLKVDAGQGWWFGARPDRWLNATDHFLPWQYSNEQKIYVPDRAENFFFVELNSSQGYSRIIKTVRGLNKKEIKSAFEKGFSFTFSLDS